MVETGTLTHLFRELIQRAMASLGVESLEATEFYLVNLLEGFARPGRPDLLDPPLGIEYLEAMQAPIPRRVMKLRRVADTALFVTGMFAESLERSLVGPDYYATLGRSAYAHLSATSGSGGMGESFEELADRFPEFVRVLGEVSAQDLFTRDQDTLRIYRRWLAHGGSREAALLVRRGLIPVAGHGRARH